MSNITKEDLSEFMEGTGHDIQLNLIKSKLKVKPKESFVMMFDQNLLATISEKNLNLTDIKVLLKVCAYLNFGNVIHLTHQTIADDLDIARQQVCKSFNKLETVGIIYKQNKSLFLNPNYLVKGDLRKSKEGEAYKNVRNNLFKELGQYIKNPDDLQEKVDSLMAF